jgi:hypothetical protein
LLEQRKIYVGFSARPVGYRFLEHFNHKGSKWTSQYRPIDVLETHPGGKNDEDEMTLQMMHRYGWWCVRGGRWCRVEMNGPPKEYVKRFGIDSRMPPEINRPHIEITGRVDNK